MQFGSEFVVHNEESRLLRLWEFAHVSVGSQRNKSHMPNSECRAASTREC
jgi:hypothetical protein